MGFGFLLIGYLVCYVLSMTMERLGVGGVAYLLGYLLMFRGILELIRYQRAFQTAKYVLYPLLLTSCYSLLVSLDTLFLWNVDLFNGQAVQIVWWIDFVLMICFRLSVLLGIRLLARDVELSHIVTKAIRNMVFVGMYGILYVFSQMPSDSIGNVGNYMELPVWLLGLAVIACDLFLLLSCNKNICPEGEEDQPMRQSRFAFINRLNETYDRNRERSIENAKQDAKDLLQRRQAAKEKRQQKKKKK
ncbi:MAG: hypothetical protein E7637_07705 [Ruminococcaceae bacterium]|nr:hypothetical protein [Oscillospiraceae bacterium]